MFMLPLNKALADWMLRRPFDQLSSFSPGGASFGHAEARTQRASKHALLVGIQAVVFLACTMVASLALLMAQHSYAARQLQGGKLAVGVKITTEGIELLSRSHPEEHCLRFPDMDLFFFPAAPEVLLEHCSSPQHTRARSLQYALRLCLARPNCTSLQWSRVSGSVTLCERQQQGHNEADPRAFALQPAEAAGLLGGEGPCKGTVVQSSVVTAVRAELEPPLPGGSQGSHNCPARQHSVPGPARKPPNCNVCPGGSCKVLPGMRLAPGFDDTQVQNLVVQQLGRGFGYRAFNPSLAIIAGQAYLVGRVSNYTLPACEPAWSERRKELRTSQKLLRFMATKNLLCPLGPSSGALQLQPHGCTLVPWDPSRIQAPHAEFSFARHCSGVEDARSFVWRDRLHLLGTINQKANESFGCQNSRLGAGIVNHMGLVRLTQGLSQIEGGALPRCEGVSGRQKNWMPLVYRGRLYMVARTHPLLVLKLDESGGCTVHQEELEAPISLQAVLSYGSFLSGGSPFTSLPGPEQRFLSIAHHAVKHSFGRSYSHQFVIISAQGTPAHPVFSIEWVSEAFRLPDGPRGFNPVQYATGLLLQNDTLFVSYGIGDCYMALAEVPGFLAKLAEWEEQGIGTQA